VRETTVSLDAIVTRSFSCLVATASWAHNIGARGERENVVLRFVRGVSQEGEGRALRLITTSNIVLGHRVVEPHAFLLRLHSWLAVNRRSPVVLSDHLLTARSNAPAQWQWPARCILRLIVRLSWHVGSQVCVDVTSITEKALQAGDEPCIRRPERRRLLDELLGARPPQPKHALMHGDLVHGEALIKAEPFGQGPHVTALRVLRDEVAALLHLD